MPLIILAAGMTTLAVVGAVRAQTAPVQVSLTAPPPAAGQPLLPADPLGALELSGSEKQLGSVTIVDVQGQPFARALHVVTHSLPTIEWNLQLAAFTTNDIKQGDVCYARFWLRCVDSMTAEGSTTFVLEQSHGDFSKAAEMRVSAGPQWREINIPFRSAHDFPAGGESRICFRAGFDRQTIEIGGIEVLNLGPSAHLEDLPRTKTTYAGRAADAPWRKEALDRIEQIRKGDLKVSVTGADGKPVAGAQVHAVLKRHEFGFGSCVTTDLLTGASPDSEEYRKIVQTNFNRAVFENDMKWPAVYDGVPQATDRALDWLLERHIAVRGHNLVWPSWKWLPRQLKPIAADPARLRSVVAQHITDTVGHFKGKLYQWDVVNEPYTNHDLLDLLGKDVMIDWYKLARKADPDCLLFLNEFGIVDSGGGDRAHQQSFYDNIKWLKDSGAPIDGIGIQSHFAAVLTDPATLLKIFDRYSEFGLPIESTELSLNVDDNQLQADYMRDYLTACFSHPNVHSVMLWGFWEKRHWRPSAALYRADWSIKPVGQAWIDLVQKDWKTDASLTTGSDGTAKTRGFCGDYEVTVTIDGRSKVETAHLSREGAVLKITLN